MNPIKQKALSVLIGIGLAIGSATSAWSQDALKDVMKARGLTEKDVLAAAKTYTPTVGVMNTSSSARAGRAAS